MTRLARIDEVHRLDLGFFVRPATEFGTGQPRVETVYSYLVNHPELTIIFDTGIGAADQTASAPAEMSMIGPGTFSAGMMGSGS